MIACGAVAGLGQAPTDAWYLTLLAFAGAFWLSVTASDRSKLGQLWFFVGLGYFAVSLRWIVEPFLVDVARHGWMAPFALSLMAAGFALFWWAAAHVAARWGRTLSLVGALMAAEALRSFALTGFPWALVGHIWIETPIAQLAALTGHHGLNLVTFGVAASLATIVRGNYQFAIVPAACLAAWPLLSFDVSNISPDRPLVRIVHPNIPQNEKWEPALRASNFDKQLLLTQSETSADLVVWPESSVTELMENAQPAFNVMSDFAGGAPLITGIQRRSQSQIYHNSFVVLGRGGDVAGLYDKQHLVPFGEYIPGGELAGKLGIRGLAATEGGGFTAGEGAKTLSVPGIGTIRPLICYEGIFPEEVRTLGERPDLLVLITNDGWFGNGAGPMQHLRQAQLLSISLGLPMVRSANSGYSAIIDGHGHISVLAGLEEAVRLEGRLPEARPETLYARFGDLPVLCIVFAIFLIGRTRTKEYH